MVRGKGQCAGGVVWEGEAKARDELVGDVDKFVDDARGSRLPLLAFVGGVGRRELDDGLEDIRSKTWKLEEEVNDGEAAGRAKRKYRGR